MNNSGGLSRLEILALQDLAARNQLVNMTAAQCSQEFGGAYQSDFESVLLVTNARSQASSLLQTAEAGAFFPAHKLRGLEQDESRRINNFYTALPSRAISCRKPAR